MNFKTTLIAALFAGLLAGPANADQSQVRADSCEFLALLKAGGGEAGIAKLKRLFSHSPEVAERVGNALASMNDMTFGMGKAYVVADFGGLAEQHFLVVPTKPFGTLFFRLRYELAPEKLALENIAFNTDYKEMFDDGPFAQDPVEFACE